MSFVLKRLCLVTACLFLVRSELSAFADDEQESATGPLSPVESLQAIVPRPGFRVELVAAEPLVMDPVAFDWGPDGRLWVVEMADYPVGIDGRGKPGGRVRVLEDVDQDGSYENSTLFLDAIPFPTGIICWRDGVLVSAAPDIFYAEDSDGDGRCDARESLYTGFGLGNQQHRVNGFTWGLDNWVYCASGDSGGSIRSLKTGQSLQLRSHDLRIRPDSGHMEPILGSTQFGRNRDDWGNWFGNDNVTPVWHYVLKEHYLKRNPRAVSGLSDATTSFDHDSRRCYPISTMEQRFNDLHMANRFTSTCGTIIYRDTLFGKGYNGNALVSEPVHNLVHRKVVVPDGITFRYRRADDEQESEFLASSDNWFRPTTIKVGPDGALYVADMYRAVIEHTQYIPREVRKGLDIRAGHDRGRIYRVLPEDASPRSIPRLSTLSTAELVRELASRSGWVRDTVQRILVNNKDGSAIPLLEEMAGGHPQPLSRLHALCTLNGLGSLESSVVMASLEDEHPGIRRHAIRLSEAHLNSEPGISEKVATMASDPDPQVLLQVAYSLGEWNNDQAGVALAKLASECSDDRFFRAAIASSLDEDNIAVFMGELLVPDRDDQGTQRLDFWIPLATSVGDEQLVGTILAYLVVRSESVGLQERYELLADVLNSLERRGLSVEQVEYSGHDASKLAAAIRTNLNDARRAAQDESLNLGRREAAIALLGRDQKSFAEDLEVLGDLVSPRHSAHIQSAAVRRLGSIESDGVPAAMLRDWSALGPRIRGEILQTLFQRTSWLDSLLSSLGEEIVAINELDASQREHLRNHSNEQIRDRANRFFADFSNPDRNRVIDDYKGALSLAGDVTRGKILFKENCSVCHRLRGVGNEVGPDLATLQNRDPLSLLIAILDPSRNVESKYNSYLAETDSGMTHHGIIRNETGDQLSLVTAQAKEIRILRSELEQLTTTGKSIMPEGLEKEISQQDLADIVRYVRQAGADYVAPNQVGRFARDLSPTSDGSLLLPAVRCEIYGDNLELEQLDGYLFGWQSERDLAVWPISVRQAGEYEIWIHATPRPNDPDVRVVVQCGDNSFEFALSEINGRSEFQWSRLGRVDLPAGAQRLSLQLKSTASDCNTWIKALRLVPQD